MFWEHHVVKFPVLESKVTYSQALRSTAFFHKNFWNLVAQTEIEKEKFNSYVVKQDFVPWMMLGEFIQKNGISPEVLGYMQAFANRAWQIYKDDWVTFDILWSSTRKNESESWWEDCKNIIVTPNGESKYIDTVDASKSLWQWKIMNNLAQLFHWRKKRVTLLEKLLDQLHSTH
jgi:hypothetical protein